MVVYEKFFFIFSSLQKMLKYLHPTSWYTFIDITKEIQATWDFSTFVFYFGYRLILIFSAILRCVTNQKVEKSLRSSDLLCNICNCWIVGYKYFNISCTLENIKKNVFIDAHTNTEHRIYWSPRKWQNLLNFLQGDLADVWQRAQIGITLGNMKVNLFFSLSQDQILCECPLIGLKFRHFWNVLDFVDA